MYIGSGQMIAAINPSANPGMPAIRSPVSLAAATSPYAILYSNKDTINLSGLGVFTFPGAVIGSSYYIVVRHRNSLETWVQHRYPSAVRTFRTISKTPPRKPAATRPAWEAASSDSIQVIRIKMTSLGLPTIPR